MFNLAFDVIVATTHTHIIYYNIFPIFKPTVRLGFSYRPFHIRFAALHFSDFQRFVVMPKCQCYSHTSALLMKCQVEIDISFSI